MSIADEQRRFYEALHDRYGDSPKSLSFNDRETQYERFERLATLFAGETGPFTVHEVGCGLGHFGDFLEAAHPQAAFSGSDISERFVEACRKRHPGATFHLRDITARPAASDRYDYLTLSGVLNPRLNAPPDVWQTFVFDMLRAMYSLCRRGIAANFITSYVDAERVQDDLHYQDPREVLDFATRELSRHLEIDAAGPLYEYTLRVYRPEYVRSRYAGEAFERYFRGR